MASSASPVPLSPRASTLGVASALVLICQLMITLDSTVLYAALPQIHASFAFSLASLSWVQNAYALAFGGCMLLGARLGDVLGRRRVLLLAIAAFTLASLGAGLAQSAAWLLSARAVQGLAAACAAPAALAFLMDFSPHGPERIRAISFYTAVSGAGSAIGLVLGGLMTDAWSWRSVLLINLPVGAMLLLLAPRYLPQQPAHSAGRTCSTFGTFSRFDLSGAITGTLAMTTLVYSFIYAATPGFRGLQLALLFCTGSGLLLAFILIEQRAAQALLPLRLFACGRRSAAYLCRTLMIGGMLGTFFFLMQYVQAVRGYSAFQAGLAFVPLALTQCLTVILVVPKLTRRIGSTALLALGLCAVLSGMAWLSQITYQSSFFPQIFLPTILLGLGTGAALVPLTSAGMSGIAAQDTGAASGLINVTHHVGGSLGTAIIVTIAGLTGSPAADLTVQAALTHAVATSAMVSAGLMGLALLVTCVFLREPSTV
ncbi:MFS transporter [Paraburkholderia bonniea]|uniref:MFS transporter n=1 Tax=Paraburkholderia bonniea TaxID=2152891 RepID=UPI001291F40E|nr:MFS transporter [Paraburkholderia bonniea]